MSEQEFEFPVESATPMGTPIALASTRRSPALRAWALVALTTCAVALLGYLGWDDVRFHDKAAQQTARAAGLSTEVMMLKSEQARLNQELTAVQGDNARLLSQARNPTLAMWNSCGGPCTIAPNSVRVGSVPDTFQLQINFTADVPVRTYIFTFRQWAQFDQCGFTTRCVTGSYRAFDAATSFSQTVDEAEGCSAYVWVLQADRQGTIKPDVRVHYQPASQPTGVCAVSP